MGIGHDRKCLLSAGLKWHECPKVNRYINLSIRHLFASNTSKVPKSRRATYRTISSFGFFRVNISRICFLGKKKPHPFILAQNRLLTVCLPIRRNQFMGRHYGPRQPRIQMKVHGYLLVHSSAPLECTHLLPTARSVHAIHCANSFGCFVTQSRAPGKVND